MYEWRRQIQQIVDEIDGCIRSHDDAALTLRSLSRTLGYSEYYTTRKFREISGMQLRDYLRRRRLAFAHTKGSDTDLHPVAGATAGRADGSGRRNGYRSGWGRKLIPVCTL